MFPSRDSLRAVLLALIAALVPAVSAAAPITLRYDFTAVITSTAYSHWCYDDFETCEFYEQSGYATTYQGPPLSTRGDGSLTVEVGDRYLDWNGAPTNDYEASFSYSILGLFSVGGAMQVSDFDALDRSMSLWSYNGYDLFEMTIAPVAGYGYGGRGHVWWEQDDSGVDWAQAEFRIYDVTVTDLSAPQPAPVPLPAALPLLAGGIAGLGWLGRRRARA